MVYLLKQFAHVIEKMNLMSFNGLGTSCRVIWEICLTQRIDSENYLFGRPLINPSTPFRDI